MFERIRLTKSVGKVKGDGCEAALKAAWADLDRVMAKNGTDTIVATWTLNGRKGWGFEPEVECEDKGKKQVVKMESLLIKQGEGPAYKKITGDRMLEIMGALQGDSNMMIGARVAMMQTVDYRGELYYVAPTVEHEGVIAWGANRNTRAVKVMRDDLLPLMQGMGDLLKAVPEFEGTEIKATAKTYNKKGEETVEVFIFRVGTEALLSFFAGELSEQEIIDKGAVLYAEGNKPPVKMDVSFVDAED